MGNKLVFWHLRSIYGYGSRVSNYKPLILPSSQCDPSRARNSQCEIPPCAVYKKMKKCFVLRKCAEEGVIDVGDFEALARAARLETWCRVCAIDRVGEY